MSNTLRTREKPLECTPEEGSASRTSPTRIPSPETIFAVDADTMELIVQAKNAGEEDIIVLDGEEDVFDVEEEVVEENEEVWEAIDEALSSDEE